MDGLEYIQRKQVAWAIRNGYTPVGSTFQNEGKKNYLENQDNNLFRPLTNETRTQFMNADGGETKDYLKNGKHYRPKINALHSSSAIVVNTFQYWHNKDVYPILYACKLCSKRPSGVDIMYENIGSNYPKIFSTSRNPSANEIKFEEKKFEISSDRYLFPRTPNIDVVIENFQTQTYAIESKFTEPYTYKYKKEEDKRISQRYIDKIDFAIWKGLDSLRQLAIEISKENNNNYLDSAQLIKHILGLKKAKKNFRLLYLWYDVIGLDGTEHRKEIEQFAKKAKEDNIKFSHITYQEVIMKLAQEFYGGNEEYCNYLTERYV